MKKLLVAMMALCAVAMGFTSCEKKADPVTQPIAGHTYQYDEALTGGYIKVTFHTNYKCTQEVKETKDSQPIANSRFVWDMAGSTITVRYADNTMDVNTGENLSNKLMYNGVYDADKKTVTLSMATNPLLVMVCQFVE